MKKIILTFVLFLLVGGVFFAGKELYINNLQQESNQLGIKLLIPEGIVQKGSESAKVEIVEFMDPQCESCRDFSVVVKRALVQYKGLVRLSIRYIPFHQHSKFAIKILEASRKQDKYWEVLDIIFRYQDYWGGHHGAKPELLWSFLPQAGVNVSQIKSDIESHEKQYEQIITRDFNDAKKLKIQATPAFFVNGQRLQQFGAGAFFKLIEDQLSLK